MAHGWNSREDGGAGGTDQAARFRRRVVAAGDCCIRARKSPAPDCQRVRHSSRGDLGGGWERGVEEAWGGGGGREWGAGLGLEAGRGRFGVWSAAIGRDEDGWFVDITNRSGQTLEAYEITIDSPALNAHLRRDDCCFASIAPGPVPPGGSVRVRLDKVGSTKHLGRHAVFSLAMFSDGSFEGSSRARDVLMQRRAQAEKDAAFWIDTIDKVTSGRPTDAARRLSTYRAARSMYADVSSAALAAFGIPDLIKSAEQDPGRFADAAAATRAGIGASRDALALRLAQVQTAR